MAGTLVTVKSGPCQQFTGSKLDKDATVWNRDSLNGVWISSNQNVTPGNGLLLPPQASCNWSGKQLYACLDVGNILPVVLQLSNDVNTVTDPVGIAEAIAIAGVPSVLLTDVLTTGSGQFILPLASLSILNISKYASLEISVFGTDINSNINVSCNQLLQASGIVCDRNIFTQNAPNGTSAPAGAFNGYASWVMPVVGETLRIDNNDPSKLVTVIVTGSNRPVQSVRRVLQGNPQPARVLVNPIASGAGVISYLQAAEGGSAIVPDWTSFNGKCSLTVLTNAYNGSLNYIFRDVLGGSHTVPILTMVPATTTYQLEMAHPFPNVNWGISSAAATPINSVLVTITPQNYN